MKVLFWGTPEFALPALRAIEGGGHRIVGIVTRRDRPAGRGRKLRPSPVKEAAGPAGYPVLAPHRPRGGDFLGRLRSLRPDVSVVVAYGHILGGEVLRLPPRGSINLHPSLLPELRGAAPIPWAILRGHALTGVTVMRMVEKMDAGPILLQVEEEVGLRTASELSARLAEVGAEALVAALDRMESGALVEREQDEARATFAPKIGRKEARIDWRAGAPEVSNLMRAMDARPGSWTTLGERPVKLFGSVPEPRARHGRAPGTVLRADPGEGLAVAAGRGLVSVAEVQPPGKRRMTAREWIRGRGVRAGERFE